MKGGRPPAVAVDAALALVLTVLYVPGATDDNGALAQPAAVIVPLALTTVYRALRGDFTRHRRIARWTLPIWLYVSVTGVVIYWMLYRR